MADEYGSLKMAWWAQREGFPPRGPKQVQLILSDLCNQDCVFCAYRMSGYTSNELFVGDSERAKFGHDNPVRFIPTSRALAFMDEFKRAGVLGVQFTGGGEPTVHRDHEAIFQKCLDTGLKAALVSNGLKWSRHLMSAILPRFAWVRVSLDAADPITYSRIRRTQIDNFDRVVGHVAELAGWIRTGKTDCVLGIGFVVTPDNYKEVIDGVRLARETGARYIRLSAMFNPEGERPYRNIYDEIRESVHAARLRYESPTFSVVDLFGERIQDLVDGAPDYRTCSYQYYTTYIGGDLRPYRCCVLAYNRRGMVAGGTVLGQIPFDVFWASRERVDDMEKFDARGCERCQFNPKQKVMNYLLSDKVTHAEFP